MKMINPYVATDHQSYEKVAISQWLELYSKSPVTREPMQMHCLMQDHTMNKIIQSMKERKITDECISNIGKHSSDTKEIVPASIPPVSIPITSNETVSKEDMKERKAKRLKANQRSKKALHVLKSDFLCEINM